MTDLALRLDNATLILRIANKDFTLTAPSREFRLPDTISPTGPASARLKLVFHERYEDAINVGTPEQLLASVEDLLGPALSLAPAESLANQWQTFKERIRRVPVLNQVADRILGIEVRITDIVLDLMFDKPASGAATFRGTFSLGVVFTPDPLEPPRLFNASLVAFGTTLSVQLAGDATAGILGFAWP